MSARVRPGSCPRWHGAPIVDQSPRPIGTLLGFYEAGRKAAGFEAGIRRALQRLLVSPEFLVRIERDPPNIAPATNYRVSELELAARLSFFFWSSIPDDELLEVAERGQLKDPAVLERQVRRMLADERAAALVNNFAGQWLYLRNVPSTRPDTQQFPDYDDNLRQAMRRETELLFDSIIREDRSALTSSARAIRSSTSGWRAITGCQTSTAATSAGFRCPTTIHGVGCSGRRAS